MRTSVSSLRFASMTLDCLRCILLAQGYGRHVRLRDLPPRMGNSAASIAPDLHAQYEEHPKKSRCHESGLP